MFTHAFLGSNDVEKSRKFYDATMAALGHSNFFPPESGKLGYNSGHGTFIVGAPLNGEAATFANGGTLGFAASSDEQVDAWHAAGVANGGTCDGGPGPRAAAPGNPRGAYLRDPDGNKICCFNMSH
ncbi:VOC family protein [Sphingomonas sp. MMS24-J13]|uniref:VOC family protein n=1 Tax=Sphingomonas sp. MMS24-J13 TaxID=3238686 RepID=UPI00384C8944